eukprot:625953-Amphidinium_carterae.1
MLISGDEPGSLAMLTADARNAIGDAALKTYIAQTKLRRILEAPVVVGKVDGCQDSRAHSNLTPRKLHTHSESLPNHIPSFVQSGPLAGVAWANPLVSGWVYVRVVAGFGQVYIFKIAVDVHSRRVKGLTHIEGEVTLGPDECQLQCHVSQAVSTQASSSRAEATRVEQQDAFHLGSCTKSITATLAAVLIEKGKLRWETTIKEALHGDSELMLSIHADYHD